MLPLNLNCCFMFRVKVYYNLEVLRQLLMVLLLYNLDE